MMGFLDLFWRRRAIDSRAALAEFIDHQAAFLAQKGIYEYSRARAGPYSKMLFNETAFIDAVNRARWQAFPLTLAMVGEVVEGVLRARAPAAASESVKTVRALALEVFDRYSPPPPLTASDWADARAALHRALTGVSLHPVKPVKDVPEPYAAAYFATMPIHERLRGSDFPTVRNYLKATLCNIHDKLVARADLPALAVNMVGPR
jgi:hypothetical protein